MHRERHVVRPAGGEGASRHEEAPQHHEAADRQQPVGEGVQARERHVRRADHQRDHVVAEPGEGRDDDEEDEQRGVDGEEPVERLVVHELHPRPGELGAHDHREEAAREQEEDVGDEVLDPDHLVVGVHPEVVAPRAGSVAGVVLGLGRLPDRPAHPVVEASDPGQEAERDRDERDRRQDRALPDRVPALGVANRHHDPGPDPEEERDHPRAAQEAGRGEPAQARRRRLRPVRRGVTVLDRHRRHRFLPPVRNLTSASICAVFRIFPKLGMTPFG